MRWNYGKVPFDQCKITVSIDLETVVSLYKALIQYMSSIRDMYDAYETKAKFKSKNKEYKNRVQRKKRED